MLHTNNAVETDLERMKAVIYGIFSHKRVMSAICGFVLCFVAPINQVIYDDLKRML